MGFERLERNKSKPAKPLTPMQPWEFPSEQQNLIKKESTAKKDDIDDIDNISNNDKNEDVGEGESGDKASVPPKAKAVAVKSGGLAQPPPGQLPFMPPPYYSPWHMMQQAQYAQYAAFQAGM